MGGIGNNFNKAPQMNVGQASKKVAGQVAQSASENASVPKNIEKKPVELGKDINQVKQDIKSAKTKPTENMASIASEKAAFAATLRSDPEFLDSLAAMVATQGSDDDVMETNELMLLVDEKAKDFLSPKAYEVFAKGMDLPATSELIAGKLNSAENTDPAQQDQAVSKLVNFIAGEAVNLSNGLPGC